MPAGASSVFPGSPFSSNSAGTTSAAFLKLPNGARYEALGGAAAAVAEGSEALFWNPAGLARANETSPSEMSLAYSSLLQGSYAGGAAYERPQVGPGTLGFGLVYFTQSALTAYDASGSPTGSFTPNDLALSGGYAGTMGGLHVGGVFKVIRQSLADVTGVSAAVDAGVQAEHVADLGDGALDLGGALSNLGPPLKLGAVSSPLPFSARGGAAWHASPNANVLLDVVLPVDDSPYVSFGVEAFTRQTDFVASLRLGFDQAASRHVDGLVGLTAGAGIDMKRFRLDYAWVPYGDLGMTNRVTLAFRFAGSSGAARHERARSDEDRLLQEIWTVHAPGSVVSPADLADAGRRAQLSDRAVESSIKRLGQEGRLAILRDGYAVTADLSGENSDPRLAAAASAAQRGLSKLDHGSPTQHLEALALLESAERAYLVAPSLSDRAAAQNRQIAQLRIAAFVEALRDIVAQFEAKVDKEPPSQTAVRMTDLARSLRAYVDEAARGARHLNAPPQDVRCILTVLADEYRPAGVEAGGDAAAGLESVKRMLAQLKP